MVFTLAVRRLVDGTGRYFGYRLVPQSLLGLYQIDDGAGVEPDLVWLFERREEKGVVAD